MQVLQGCSILPGLFHVGRGQRVAALLRFLLQDAAAAAAKAADELACETLAIADSADPEHAATLLIFEEVGLHAVGVGDVLAEHLVASADPGDAPALHVIFVDRPGQAAAEQMLQVGDGALGAGEDQQVEAGKATKLEIKPQVDEFVFPDGKRLIVPRRVLGGPGYQAPSDTVNVAVVGQALESAVSGDRVACTINPFMKQGG